MLTSNVVLEALIRPLRPLMLWILIRKHKNPQNYFKWPKFKFETVSSRGRYIKIAYWMYIAYKSVHEKVLFKRTASYCSLWAVLGRDLCQYIYNMYPSLQTGTKPVLVLVVKAIIWKASLRNFSDNAINLYSTGYAIFSTGSYKFTFFLLNFILKCLIFITSFCKYTRYPLPAKNMLNL